jgi:dienelactone hydrolase
MMGNQDNRILRTRPFLAFVLGLACLAANAALAGEIIHFESVTHETPYGIFRGNTGNKVEIEARLSLPPGSQSRQMPAAVVLHTCSGPGVPDAEISGKLQQLGFITLQFDSLRPRGWSEDLSCSGKLLGNEASQVADAFAALRFLASHPAVDPARIVVVGASMGAGSANQTALERLARANAGPTNPRFAAHVAFYPPVRFTMSAEALTGAPMLMLLGSRDDWTPPHRVKVMVTFWKQARPDLPVSIIEYRTGHGWFAHGQHNYAGTRSTAGACPIPVVRSPGDFVLLQLDGTLRELASAAGAERGKELAEEMRKCAKRGASITPDPSVASRSLDDMASFLKVTLKLP